MMEMYSLNRDRFGFKNSASLIIPCLGDACFPMCTKVLFLFSKVLFQIPIEASQHLRVFPTSEVGCM